MGNAHANRESRTRVISYYAVLDEQSQPTVVSREDRLHAALWLSPREAEHHRDVMQALNTRWTYRVARVQLVEI